MQANGRCDVTFLKHCVCCKNLNVIYFRDFYTRASHDLQYTRYFAYSDALKNSFFPRTIPLWNSLPSSVVSSKTIEEFKGLIKIIGPEVCVLACL